jgi:hypothetical protein
MKPTEPGEREQAALVIARPGHELRIHGWLEQARPIVFVLADGSGRTGQSRLEATSRVLSAAGAEPGSLFGRLSDARLYAALLARDVGLFLSVAEELADAFLQRGVSRVVGDAAGGIDPIHDVCRALTATAAALARWQGSRPVIEHDFPLTGRPDACPRRLRRWALWLRLDNEALQRKLAAARGYTELSAEVNDALRAHGEEAFRTECLRPAVSWTAGMEASDRPEYEHRGEERVAAGRYARVIRAYAHVTPVVAALRRHAVKVPEPLLLAS